MRNSGRLSQDGYGKRLLPLRPEQKGRNAIILALGTENENPEAYQLKVAGDGVTITGSTEAGVFYGIQSLRKSLPIAMGSKYSPSAVEIKDAPRFGYRGAHFGYQPSFFHGR